MTINRRERLVIESLIKRIGKLETTIDDHATRITVLEEQVEALLEAPNILNFSESELIDFLQEAVKKIIKRSDPVLHDHTSDEEGGDCFAIKGANLIDGTEEGIGEEETA